MVHGVADGKQLTNLIFEIYFQNLFILLVLFIYLFVPLFISSHMHKLESIDIIVSYDLFIYLFYLLVCLFI